MEQMHTYRVLFNNGASQDIKSDASLTDLIEWTLSAPDDWLSGYAAATNADVAIKVSQIAAISHIPQHSQPLHTQQGEV